MNEPHVTEDQLRHADKLVSWTLGERLRFAWYRIRLTICEMNYATRRMTELQMRLPGGHADPDASRAEADKI